MNLRPGSLSLAASGAALAASLVAYPFLPRRVAIHFRADGRADREGARALAALALPATMSGMALLNASVGSWPGGDDRDDADSGARARARAVDIAALGLFVNHLALLAHGLSLPVDMERLPRAVFGAMLIGLGNVLPKLPRNALVGIRTPWTLTDPSIWERTHHLGGYLCVAAGLLTLVLTPAHGQLARRLPIVLTLTSAAVAAAYSWLLSRRQNQLLGAD